MPIVCKYFRDKFLKITFFEVDVYVFSLSLYYTNLYVITFYNVLSLLSVEKEISKFPTTILFLSVSSFISSNLGFIYLASVLFSAPKFKTALSFLKMLLIQFSVVRPNSDLSNVNINWYFFPKMCLVYLNLSLDFQSLSLNKYFILLSGPVSPFTFLIMANRVDFIPPISVCYLL